MSHQFTRDGTESGRQAAPVVVAEDDVLLREGLVSLLDHFGFDVVGQAGDGPHLLALVRETTPELVVTDNRMPPSNCGEGFDAARMIRAELPDTAILVLSAHVDVDQAMELLDGGRGAGVRAGATRRREPLSVLSAREIEVLALMAEGRSNAGIAQRLWVAEGTVAKHVSSRADGTARRCFGPGYRCDGNHNGAKAGRHQ